VRKYRRTVFATRMDCDSYRSTVYQILYRPSRESAKSIVARQTPIRIALSCLDIHNGFLYRTDRLTLFLHRRNHG
jgi:hypothetical protein